MPGEDGQSTPRYKIKAVGEGYERVVGESDLNPDFEDRQRRTTLVKKWLWELPK